MSLWVCGQRQELPCPSRPPSIPLAMLDVEPGGQWNTSNIGRGLGDGGGRGGGQEGGNGVNLELIARCACSGWVIIAIFFLHIPLHVGNKPSNQVLWRLPQWFAHNKLRYTLIWGTEQYRKCFGKYILTMIVGRPASAGYLRPFAPNQRRNNVGINFFT